MTAEEIITKLGHKGVKATANRILVYRMLEESDHPVSLADMERLNLSMDKSSIFRVLTLFLEHDVVHSFEDGRGILNYELCRSDGNAAKATTTCIFTASRASARSVSTTYTSTTSRCPTDSTPTPCHSWSRENVPNADARIITNNLLPHTDSRRA